MTTLDDVVDDTDGVLSLREAITAATEGDTIIFAENLAGGTITLAQGQFTINRNLIIDASNLWNTKEKTPGITIDANSKSRIFEIAENISVSLTGLEMINGNSISGGAIYTLGDLTVTRCSFVSNYASGRDLPYGGGAIDAEKNAVLSIYSSYFYKNSVYDNAAAVLGSGKTTIVEDSYFAENFTTGEISYCNGGALEATSALFIKNTYFINNISKCTLYPYWYENGAVNYYGKEAVIENCVFEGNTGQGLTVSFDSAATVKNSIFLNNSGSWNGAGIAVDNSTLNLYNCTIVQKDPSYDCPCIRQSSGTINLYNSILIGKEGSSQSSVITSGTTNAYYTLSDYQSWTNISDPEAAHYIYDSSKPLFKDAAGGDYTLAEGSQAIDVGNNDYVTTETDLAGNPRISGGVVDLGAYEYQNGPQQLTIPANVSVIASGKSVTVAWDAVSNANQYAVEYSTDESFAEFIEETVNETTVTIDGLAYNTQYYFRVIAKDTSGAYLDSDPSESISVKTPSAPQLDAPTGVTLTASGTEITVTWNAVENANRYVVFYSTDETFAAQSYKTTTENHLTISDFEYDTTYYFRIQARDSNLVYPNSKYSDTQSIIIPGETAKVSISIVLSAAAPTGAACEELEESLSLAYRGDTVYAQIWMKNIDGSANGITGGYLDLSYSADAFMVQSVTSGAYYSTLNNYYKIDNGRITLLGGMAEAGKISYGINEWVLLGYVTMSVTNEGTTAVSTSVPTKGGKEIAGFNISRNLDGALKSDAIKFGAQTIETRNAIPLEAPENLTVVTGGANRHFVTWDAVENASGYTLAYSVDQETWATIDAASNSCLVTGLTYGSKVFYKVMTKGDNYRWADSEYSDSIQLTVCPMDIDGNGVINLGDYAILSTSWLTLKGETDYDFRADIDGDDLIGPSDFMFLSTNWLKSVTDPNLIYPAAKAATFADGDFVETLGADIDIDWDVF